MINAVTCNLYFPWLIVSALAASDSMLGIYNRDKTGTSMVKAWVPTKKGLDFQAFFAARSWKAERRRDSLGHFRTSFNGIDFGRKVLSDMRLHIRCCSWSFVVFGRYLGIELAQI